MDTGEDGIDVLIKLFQRKVIIENCEPATPDIDSNIVRQNLGEIYEDLELDFKLFFFMDSGSAYIVLERSE